MYYYSFSPQVNNSIPTPMSSAEPQQSSFTRRAPMKSEAEMKMEERAAAKKVHHFVISCTKSYVL